jgi:hypothetical protein
VLICEACSSIHALLISMSCHFSSCSCTNPFSPFLSRSSSNEQVLAMCIREGTLPQLQALNLDGARVRQ